MATITEQSIADNKYSLSCHEDEYIKNKYEGETRWIVVLNNGLTIYQDDDRPEVFPNSAWERLRIYCMETGNFITNMRLQFRSHTEHLPDNADGYYFVKSVLSGFGMNRTLSYFVVGVLINNIIKVTHWKIPELIPTEYEDREVKENDICLISKSNIKY